MREVEKPYTMCLPSSFILGKIAKTNEKCNCLNVSTRFCSLKLEGVVKYVGFYRWRRESVVKYVGPYRRRRESVVKNVGPYRRRRERVVKHVGPARFCC